MVDVLAFWFAGCVIAAAVLPIAFVLFRRLPDAGAGVAFILGLVFAGYAYFILRTFGVLPFGRGGYLLTVALVALAGLAVAGRDRRFRETFRRARPGLVIALALFTSLFFAYAAFRSYESSIGGTEQPMDFMYLNATLTSPAYPPNDPWLAGESASYYYFGYLQAGLLTSVSGVPASTGYNLALATFFAASATAVASVAVAFARWIMGSRGGLWIPLAGGVAVAMLLFLGSLWGVFELAAAHGHYNESIYQAFGADALLPCAPGEIANCYAGAEPRTDAWYPTEFWFWWRATRIIPGTITEFPVFSFLLGDLHPHVMSIPLVLLVIALAATTWRGRSRLDWLSHRRNPVHGLAIALILGALAFQNAWDLLTFSGIFAIAVLARNLRRGSWQRAGAATVGYAGPLLVVAVAAYLPWYVTFSSQAQGLYPYVGEGTTPAHAFLQFGPLLLACLLLLALVPLRVDRALLIRAGSAALWLPLVPLLLWAPLAAYHGQLGAALEARGGPGWATLAGYGAAVWLLASATILLAAYRRPLAPVAGIATVAALLLYGSELFLIKDVFFGSVPRLNTVFKLSYQAWILFSVAGAVGLVTALRGAARGKPAGWLAAPVGALALAGLVYGATAIPNRTQGFAAESDIDGLAGLARSDPAEYALTRWVADNVPPGSVVVEATGRAWRAGASGPEMYQGGVDYTDAGRISARTGREAPIGWYFHEIQWRGDTKTNRERFTARQESVDRIYLARDGEEVLRLLASLEAEYVVVGRLEQSRYPVDLMTSFDAFLDLVFERDGLRVYRLPVYEVMETS